MRLSDRPINEFSLTQHAHFISASGSGPARSYEKNRVALKGQTSAVHHKQNISESSDACAVSKRCAMTRRWLSVTTRMTTTHRTPHDLHTNKNANTHARTQTHTHRDTQTHTDTHTRARAHTDRSYCYSLARSGLGGHGSRRSAVWTLSRLWGQVWTLC